MSTLFEGSPATVTISRDEVIEFVSPGVGDPAPLRGTRRPLGRLLDHIHPDDRVSLRRDLTAAEAQPGILVETSPYRVAEPDGRWSWRRGTIRDLTGVPGIDGVLTVTVDVTAERLAADAHAALADLGLMALSDVPLDDLLREACEIVARFVDAPLVKILEFEPDGDGLVVRQGVGWDPGVVGEATVSAHEGSRLGHALDHGVVVIEDFALETRFERPALLADHDVVSGICVAIRMSDGSPFGILGVHRQIPTAYLPREIDFVRAVANVVAATMTNRGMTHRLREAVAEQHRLLDHLVRAEQTERSRVAAELHDDAVQVLYAVGMRLEALASDLEGEPAERARSARHEVVGAMRRLREVLMRLEPPGPDVGVAPEEAADALMQRVFGPDDRPAVHVDVGSIEVLPASSITILRRIAQETIMNVRRHAEARNVWLSFQQHDDTVWMTIRDDGRGCTEADMNRAGHIGIRVMRDRAAAAGGGLDVVSAPGQGTTVSCWLPARGYQPVV